MIRTFPIPEGEERSSDFSVKLVGDTPVELYRARVSAVPYNTVWPGRQRPKEQTELASFCGFQTDGPAAVEITTDHDFHEAVVRPLSAGVKPQMSGRKLRFTIPGPGCYTVELDGFHRALSIFADPPEDFEIKPNDPDVIAFGPGVHHPGVIDVKSGQTVYLAPGAVVYGAVQGICVHDVKILGGGILDGSWEERDDKNSFYPTTDDAAFEAADAEPTTDGPVTETEKGIRAILASHRVLKGAIRFYGCRNILISGPVCRDTCTFAVIPCGCENVVVENVKTIGMWRYNSDGIDVINSRNCIIRNCFLRDFDDCVVLKGIMGWDSHNLENILVQGCVIWCDWGRALEIGAETCADEYRNIIFEDCDVIHGNDILFDIQNLNRAEVHDVTFRDIRCEYNRYQLPTKYQSDMKQPYTFEKRDWQPLLFKMHSVYIGYFSRDALVGNIHDITVKDISVYADKDISMPKSVLEGFDKKHLTQRIRISNLTFNGKKIEKQEDANISCNDFVRDVDFR